MTFADFHRRKAGFKLLRNITIKTWPMLCARDDITEFLQNHLSLSEFSGLVACGGFSYGDVLGAGRGWASSILYNPQAKEA
jgi:hypothetical protein